ncbi:MAG: class I SAM-dependent methyltransferase [Bryobacteraceae bacterium]|nr:class I SAM-dependent methyltransferase [Bryobacteraceae bacterium]
MSVGGRIHGWLLDRFNRRYEPLVAERKRALLGGLSGHVLEIGAGTGANIKFLPKTIRYMAVEPSRGMKRALARRALDAGLSIDIHVSRAEALRLADQSVDAVVCTLVLCSVSDPERVLAEVRRVLRPGGRFVYLEHIAGPPGTRRRRRQELIAPVWRICSGGCNVNRETPELIAQAGFSRVEHELFELPLPIAGPHVAGVATK